MCVYIDAFNIKCIDYGDAVKSSLFVKFNIKSHFFLFITKADIKAICNGNYEF